MTLDLLYKLKQLESEISLKTLCIYYLSYFAIHLVLRVIEQIDLSRLKVTFINYLKCAGHSKSFSRLQTSLASLLICNSNTSHQ